MSRETVQRKLQQAMSALDKSANYVLECRVMYAEAHADEEHGPYQQYIESLDNILLVHVALHEYLERVAGTV